MMTMIPKEDKIIKNDKIVRKENHDTIEKLNKNNKSGKLSFVNKKIGEENIWFCIIAPVRIQVGRSTQFYQSMCKFTGRHILRSVPLISTRHNLESRISKSLINVHLPRFEPVAVL